MSGKFKAYIYLFVLLFAFGSVYLFLAKDSTRNKKMLYQIGCGLVDEDLNVVRPNQGNMCLYLKSGDTIVANYERAALRYVTAYGETKWSDPSPALHKLVLSNDRKHFITFTSESKKMNHKNIRSDLITVRDFNNHIIKKWSLFENLNILPSRFLSAQWCNTKCFWYTHWLKPMGDDMYDGEITHANSIQEISEKEEIAGSNIWKSGNYLVYLFGPTRLAIVLSASMEQVLWSLDMGAYGRSSLHTMQIIPGGKFLIFFNSNEWGVPKDNAEKDYSSVEIMDIATMQSVWQYKSKKISKSRGGAQLLQNGNILITETEPELVARVLDPSGEDVFHFKSPFVGSDGTTISYQEINYVDVTEFLKNNHM